MKKIIQYILLSGLVMLMVNQASAQLVSRDISTGINSSGGLINVLAPDDDWDVATPGNGFQDAWCSTAVPNGFSQYGGHNNSVRFISSHLVTPSGNLAVGAPAGQYIYKMSFNIIAYAVTPVALNLTHIGGDNVITNIQVNGNNHSVNFGFNPFSSGVTIPLGVNELVPGSNTIQVFLSNVGAVDPNSPSFTGMEIKGDISYIKGRGFDFKDKDGVNKTTFCIGEDVFLDFPDAPYSIYYMKISEVIGSTVNFIAEQGGWPGYVSGIANGVNITTLFANTPTSVNFQPGKTYRITYKVFFPMEITFEKDFTYQCCDLSTDPSFWVNTGNGQLMVDPKVNGTHTWNLYSIPPQNIGTYTKIRTYNTPTFSYNTSGGCYYITHTITNACGTACSGQVVCSADCIEKKCNMVKPGNLISGQTNNLLNWSTVPDATYYTVEINPYDLRCCPDPNPGGVSIYHPSKYYDIYSGHTYTWDREAIFPSEGTGPINPGPHCFSWRVIAHCPDGGQTISDYSCSWDDGSLPPPNDPTGLVGNQPANSETTADEVNTGTKMQHTASMPDLPGKGLEVNLFPNPSKGVVSLDIKTDNDVTFSIQVYDLVGKMVGIFEDLKTNNKQANVKLYDSLPKGVYIIKVTTSDNQVMDKKLVIE